MPSGLYGPGFVYANQTVTNVYLISQRRLANAVCNLSLISTPQNPSDQYQRNIPHINPPVGSNRHAPPASSNTPKESAMLSLFLETVQLAKGLYSEEDRYSVVVVFFNPSSTQVK